VRASIFMKALLDMEGKVSQSTLREELQRLLLALQQELDHAEIVNLLTKYNKHGSIFRMIDHERISEEPRNQLILQMFKYTMHRELLSVSIRLIHQYERFLISNSDFCIEAIIFTTRKSPYYFEMKMWILNKFIPKMNYQQVDRFLETIEDHYL